VIFPEVWHLAKWQKRAVGNTQVIVLTDLRPQFQFCQRLRRKVAKVALAMVWKKVRKAARRTKVLLERWLPLVARGEPPEVGRRSPAQCWRVWKEPRSLGPCPCCTLPPYKKKRLRTAEARAGAKRELDDDGLLPRHFDRLQINFHWCDWKPQSRHWQEAIPPDKGGGYRGYVPLETLAQRGRNTIRSRAVPQGGAAGHRGDGVTD
jgi:hypothetical protein